MKIQELFEAKVVRSYEEQQAAISEFEKYLSIKGRMRDDPTEPETLEKLKAATKVLGRAYRVYGGEGYHFQGTAGNIIDRLVRNQGETDSTKAGTPSKFPTGNESTALAFVEQLALALKALKPITRSYYGRVWTLSTGQKYRDPQNGLEFHDQQSYNDAWDEIQKHGKRVYVKLPLTSSPSTLVKIGKYLLQQNETVRRAFSDNPESEYHIKIQTASILKNPINKKMDFTDQQAASLQDIAATKSTNAIEKLKAILAVVKSKEDVKKLIADSEKLADVTKQKLQAIIDGARDFREDD
jgi:hypothetical protein